MRAVRALPLEIRSWSFTALAAQAKSGFHKNTWFRAMTPTIPSRRGDFDLMLERKVCSDLCIMDHYISPGDVPSNEGISVFCFANYKNM